jgi:uncharacterized protein (DUF3820 family)
MDIEIKLQSKDIMPFGKHKGEKLKDLIKTDANYCQWIIDEFDHKSDIWKYMNKHKKTIKNNYVEKIWGDDEDLSDAYGFAMHDGGGCPFIV